MLTNELERKICEKFRKRDTKGFVHCFECPLRNNDTFYNDTLCKANSHYNQHTKEWEYDKEFEVDERPWNNFEKIENIMTDKEKEIIEELKTRYLTMSQCPDKEELHKANESIDIAIASIITLNKVKNTLLNWAEETDYYWDCIELIEQTMQKELECRK